MPTNPRERKNWARACVEVVTHYRDGKWGGFHTPLRYVEIWNEPDNTKFWPKPHTALEFFQLYEETASALKDAFPDLQVGGPGLTQAGFMTPRGQEWARDFFEFVHERHVPLDFFSWHLYSNDPQDWVRGASLYREALDTAGLAKTPLHLTEWNTDIRNLPDNSAESLALRTGGKGAAILTAAWVAMQQTGVEAFTIYRGTDTDLDAPHFYGIFYADGRPKRVALAFSLWAKTALCPHSVAVSLDDEPGLWVLAGKNDAGETAVLIANPTDHAVRYALVGTSGIPASDGRAPPAKTAPRPSADKHGLLVLEVSDAADEVVAWEVAGDG